MFFEDSNDEKKLFEDIQFKRKVAFLDDDDIINVTLKPFSKSLEKSEMQDVKIQVNIQNDLASSSSQTRSKKNKDIQTENDNQIDLDPNDIDMGKISRILERRSRIIEEAIFENLGTAAFNNYDVDWYGGNETTTNVFTLCNKQLLKEEEMHIVSTEWNCSGTTVCCAYGRFDHESVCTHKGMICTWNIDRLKIDVNKPDVSIETPCCISSMAPHPEYPGIIAVGFFNGDINVYDIRQFDPLVASIIDKKELHQDEVTVLKWIKDAKTSKKKFLLISGSRDGKLLIWNALPAKNQLKLVEGFIMLTDHLPRDNHKSNGTEMAVSSIAISNEDKDILMVGCDSGGLFKCSFTSDKPANLKWQDDFPIELKSPVDLAFEPQYGPIYSISHSPFHRNLILTCGTDSDIKLYSMLQTSYLSCFSPDNGYLYCVQWSPTRPCVFACGSQKGNILIYDLYSGSSETIKASENNPIYSLSFNTQRAGYMASGDKSGVVKIWKLSQNLTRVNTSELNKLNDISEKPFEKS